MRSSGTARVAIDCQRPGEAARPSWGRWSRCGTDLRPWATCLEIDHAGSMGHSIEHGSVVVAVDGSGHADRAVRWAARHACLERRPLVLVAAAVDALPIIERAAAAARDVAPQVPVTQLPEHGDPRRILLDLSDDAGLLVLGSRGRGAIRSMLLGSVSAAVSAHAACPVVVCRPPGAADTRQGVLVGADGTPESRRVVEFGYRFAALHRLPLSVVHCYWDAVVAVAAYREARGEPTEVPALVEERALLAESVAGLAEQFPDVAVTLGLRHGLVDEALAPRGEAWDLVVVGRHPMTSLDRVLSGSIATAVVERSRSTVAIVPEPASLP